MIPPKTPHEPPVWHEIIPQVRAIQALGTGSASPEQQIEALTFIVERLCGTYDLSYRPNDVGATQFAEGRRFVGLQIVSATKQPIGVLESAKKRADAVKQKGKK